ncbi:hypothetical protein B5V03_19630 [Bradyrhizobium betae]|uniref:Uncharacterized protein n=1 Tax=Bradyrhizobium betae TaxID=244734 RepID=A0A4Q1V1A1_9BRAD|nr:hypothetical protein B5V03_19630 [Bradyrhizobium betae]
MIDSREDSAGSSQRAAPHSATSTPNGRMGAPNNRNSRVIWKSPGTSQDPARRLIVNPRVAPLVSPLILAPFVTAKAAPVHRTAGARAFDVVIDLVLM